MGNYALKERFKEAGLENKNETKEEGGERVLNSRMNLQTILLDALHSVIYLFPI